MIQDKYVAYDADSGIYETFEYFRNAKKWLTVGFGEETSAGNSYIAKITHTTSAEFDTVGEIILNEV